MTRRNPLEASDDLIEEFQRIVRRSKRADEKTIELSIAMSESIALALNHISRPGRPAKRGRTKVIEAAIFARARGRLTAEGLDRVARDMQKQFPKLSPKTIKRRLGRR